MAKALTCLSLIRGAKNLVPLVLIARFVGFERDDPHAVMPQIDFDRNVNAGLLCCPKGACQVNFLNAQPALPKGLFPP